MTAVAASDRAASAADVAALDRRRERADPARRQSAAAWPPH